MATGKASDFQIYNEQYYGGMWEGLSQVTEGFNAAANGAIRLVQNDLLGEFEKESFFKSISGFIARRDTTSVAAVSDLPMTQDENISVKINRRIGPIAQTFDAWKKVGKDIGEMSFQVGRMVGEEKAKDLINTAILCAEAAIDGQTSLEYDGTSDSPATLNHSKLVSGMNKLGDFSGRIALWVMHSKVYHDLLKGVVTDQAAAFQHGNFAINTGNVYTFGRPVLVIDAPALTDANGSLTDTYNVLGLVQDAVIATESEDQNIVAEPVTGFANLIYRIQGEYAFNIRVKGFKWDTANGLANPTDGTLGTTTNWDLAVTSYKNAAGVRIVTQ